MQNFCKLHIKKKCDFIFYQARLRLKVTEVHLRCSWTVNAIAPRIFYYKSCHIQCDDLKSADILSFQIWAWIQRLNRIFLYTSSFLFHCTGSWLEKGCRGAVSLKFICIYYGGFVLWQWQLNIWLSLVTFIFSEPCHAGVRCLSSQQASCA